VLFFTSYDSVSLGEAAQGGSLSFLAVASLNASDAVFSGIAGAEVVGRAQVLRGLREPQSVHVDYTDSLETG
jgi:hypothetical protein